ncbi:metallophosphoesterase [Nanoarchaeota archaeon]
MKILAFVDLHGDTALLKSIVKRAKKDDVDLVVCAGDFTVFEDGAGYVLKKLNEIGKPVLLIPGNHETPEMTKKAEKQYSNIIDLHNKSWQKDNYLFLGYGTGGFSKKDAGFRKAAREWRRKVKDEKLILVVHAPPHGTKLDEIDGKSVGNEDIRKGIERLVPKLVICGHLHENADKIDSIGKTKVVNPGYEGMVIEI